MFWAGISATFLTMGFPFFRRNGLKRDYYGFSQRISAALSPRKIEPWGQNSIYSGDYFYLKLSRARFSVDCEIPFDRLRKLLNASERAGRQRFRNRENVSPILKTRLDLVDSDGLDVDLDWKW